MLLIFFYSWGRLGFTTKKEMVFGLFIFFLMVLYILLADALLAARGSVGKEYEGGKKLASKYPNNKIKNETNDN